MFISHYLIETLKELEKENIKNDLVIITKCLIPNFVLLNLKRLQQKGQNIVIYLSYSGLDTQLEPNINHENIIKNFKNLKKYKIPTIHYYRPFLPQNAPKENIQKTLKLIHKYTSISVITGLMFVPTLLEKQNFWPELKKMNTRDLQESISLWPKTAWDFFYKAYEESQFFYQTNTCALNAILKKPSLQYYGTYECKHFNHCSLAQRKLCQSKKEQIQKEEIVKKLKIFLKKLGITPSFHYKFDHQNSLKLEGINLDIKALAYLSFQLGIKVYIPNAMKLNKIYNSTLNGKRPFIVNEGEK